MYKKLQNTKKSDKLMKISSKHQPLRKMINNVPVDDDQRRQLVRGKIYDDVDDDLVDYQESIWPENPGMNKNSNFDKHPEKTIYQDHSLFFTLIKSKIDSNSMSRGSEISVPDNIRNFNIPPYRDQMNYRAIFYDEFFKITGVESKYKDSTQDNDWEAAI